ncbi:MAG TPA: hypothetical protein DIU00_08575 [Phycisphaerales bacterium]|nr:hypothetical protein [Phycisphaerales bacterium]
MIGRVIQVYGVYRHASERHRFNAAGVHGCHLGNTSRRGCGKTFIAGQDPVAFCERFKKKVTHVHVKDVSESLAATVRGEQTGIAVSHCAIGDGVNAENIKKILAILRDIGYDGVLSMECEGAGGPMIEKSLAWLRRTLGELNIKSG